MQRTLLKLLKLQKCQLQEKFLQPLESKNIFLTGFWIALSKKNSKGYSIVAKQKKSQLLFASGWETAKEAWERLMFNGKKMEYEVQ